MRTGAIKQRLQSGRQQQIAIMLAIEEKEFPTTHVDIKMHFDHTLHSMPVNHARGMHPHWDRPKSSPSAGICQSVERRVRFKNQTKLNYV